MTPEDTHPGDPSLGMVLGVLWRRRRLLAVSVFAFAVVAAGLSLVMPRTYVARCTMLPPVESSPSLIGLSGGQGPLAFLGIQSDATNSAQLFQQILSSRTVTEAVVEQVRAREWLKLQDRPDRAALETAVRILRGVTRFDVKDAGMLEITVRASTGWFASGAEDEIVRRRAAEIAGAFVQQLDLVNREKNLSRAKQIRVYLERQLEDNLVTLRTLGDELTRFREEHGALALDAQTAALVQTAAGVKARLLEKEVELGLAQQTMTEENPAIGLLKDEIGELRRSLVALEGSSKGPADVGRGAQIDLSAAQIPELQLQQMGYERELQAQVQLQTYIREQYYQAKIEEARDTPTIQVLDPAVPPEERESPKRAMMVLGAAFAGALVGLVGAGLLEWFEKRRPTWFPAQPRARA